MILRLFIPMVAVLACVFVPERLFAWGSEGHQIIADIAEARLMPTAARRVAEILNGARMRDVSMYADSIRPLRRETARWHFVNIAPGANSYVHERDCRFVEGQGDCLINAITRAIDDVRRNDEKRQAGLKFLIHFVADAHQPFHAVAEARGGNDITVNFLGRSSNLHRVWDTDLIRSAKFTPAEYADWLIAAWVNHPAGPLTPPGTPVDWAMESRAIGLRALVPNGARLDEAYVREWTSILNERLMLAGARLADLLNAILE